MNAKPSPDRIVGHDRAQLSEGICQHGHGRLSVRDLPPHSRPPSGSRLAGWCPVCCAYYVAMPPGELGDRGLAEIGRA